MVAAAHAMPQDPPPHLDDEALLDEGERALKERLGTAGMIGSCDWWRRKAPVRGHPRGVAGHEHGRGAGSHGGATRGSTIIWPSDHGCPMHAMHRASGFGAEDGAGDASSSCPACTWSTSSLNRPFDRRVDERERSEAAAVEVLIEAVGDGKLDLVTSRVLVFECIERMPGAEVRRANRIQEVLGLARLEAFLSPEVLARARQLEERAGLRPFDALHLGCAESENAVFVTTDRRTLLNRVRRSRLARTPVMDPMEAVVHFGLGRPIRCNAEREPITQWHASVTTSCSSGVRMQRGARA